MQSLINNTEQLIKNINEYDDYSPFFLLNNDENMRIITRYVQINKKFGFLSSIIGLLYKELKEKKLEYKDLKERIRRTIKYIEPIIHDKELDYILEIVDTKLDYTIIPNKIIEIREIYNDESKYDYAELSKYDNSLNTMPYDYIHEKLKIAIKVKPKGTVYDDKDFSISPNQYIKYNIYTLYLLLYHKCDKMRALEFLKGDLIISYDTKIIIQDLEFEKACNGNQYEDKMFDSALDNYITYKILNMAEAKQDNIEYIKYIEYIEYIKLLLFYVLKDEKFGTYRKDLTEQLYEIIKQY
jgi:hypothetical protein